MPERSPWVSLDGPDAVAATSSSSLSCAAGESIPAWPHARPPMSEEDLRVLRKVGRSSSASEVMSCESIAGVGGKILIMASPKSMLRELPSERSRR